MNPDAYDTLQLPMDIRQWGDPFGYVHGQVNHEGIRHPGDDLNNGPDAWADDGAPLYAPGDSLILFAGSAGGWGTLIVGKLAKKLKDPRDGVYKWFGWRLGHPKTMTVKAGDRVRQGDLVGTCGNGGNGVRGQKGAMAPHAHYDLFVLDEFEAYADRLDPTTRARTGLPWTYWDRRGVRDNFRAFFRDPRTWHPELARAHDRVGR